MTTVNYQALRPDFTNKTPDEWLDIFDTKAVSQWETFYRRDTAAPVTLVGVPNEGFEYIFDIAHERCVGVFGISGGRHHGARPSSRMRGHPQSYSGYHRGHLIAHTLGGGTDINLVGQLGSMNIGPFRQLEKQAVASPGSLYFVRLLYTRTNTGDLPDTFEQGLVQDPRNPVIRVNQFTN